MKLKLYCIFFASIFMAGCQSLISSDDVYSSSVKKRLTDVIDIEVSSRLEHIGKQKTQDLSEQACHEKRKKRFLVVEQTSTHTHSRDSQYPTGFHTIKTQIKCR